ncbi:MAG TPA: type II toxin-antitoxin system PemK/MazF family toxin [Opitutales bacterium]|nr:type II toxin-antitoxin system PemK/MazF family toxin [Opitutales bacterium]
MVAIKFVPQRGDIVHCHFDEPPTGHEQGFARYAIVLSPSEYNKSTGLCIVAPISSKEKGYPFEVPVRIGKIHGVILADQIKSIDYLARQVRTRVARANASVIEQLQDKLFVLLQ